MNSVPNPRAIFGVAKKDVVGVIARAMTMYNQQLANAAMFLGSPIGMVAFLALITALVGQQQNTTGTKAKGSATLRNTKRNAVWTAMEMLRVFVQGQADLLSPDAAASLIEAAGLLVATVPVHQKEALAATLTTTPGVVHVDANASLLAGPAAGSKRIMFNWQWSVDGGKTWSDAHSTPLANTDFLGLTLMSTYSFRVSVTIAKVTGSWSQPVSLLVH